MKNTGRARANARHQTMAELTREAARAPLDAAAGAGEWSLGCADQPRAISSPLDEAPRPDGRSRPALGRASPRGSAALTCRRLPGKRHARPAREHLVDEPVLHRFLCGHEVVALHVLGDLLEWLPGV